MTKKPTLTALLPMTQWEIQRLVLQKQFHKKLSKEIDEQAREVGVQVIDITSKPVMTKKVNSDGTITYDQSTQRLISRKPFPKRKARKSMKS